MVTYDWLLTERCCKNDPILDQNTLIQAWENVRTQSDVEIPALERVSVFGKEQALKCRNVDEAFAADGTVLPNEEAGAGHKLVFRFNRSSTSKVFVADKTSLMEAAWVMEPLKSPRLKHPSQALTTP